MGRNEKSIKLTWYCKLYGRKRNTRRSISERLTAQDDIWEDGVFNDIIKLDYIYHIIEFGKNEAQSVQRNELLDNYEFEKLISCVLLNRNWADTDVNKAYVASQVFECLVFQIRKEAFEYLNQYLHDRNINDVDFEQFQNQMEDKCKKISQLFLYYRKYCEQENKDITAQCFWEKLIGVIRDVINGRNRINTLFDEGENRINADTLAKYISKYLDDKLHQGKEKCVGCYIFDRKQFPKTKPLIAFSGYTDCSNQMIIDALGIKINPFYIRSNKLFTEICDSMSARMIHTNMQIPFFYACEAGFKKTESLNEAIIQIINGKKKPNDVRERYRCSERKLFSKFKKRKGKLYSSLEPCKYCEIAIDYYIGRGIIIDVSFPGK